MANAEPGWYPDPENSAQLRYYDGELWTDHYHAAEQSQQAFGGGVSSDPAFAGGVSTPRTVGLSAPGDLLAAAWAGVKARIGPLLGITIGFGVLFAILYAIFLAWLFSSVDGLDDFDDIGDTIASFIIGYIVFALVMGLLYSAYSLIVARLMHQHFRGHQVSLGTAWDTAKSRVFAFFGTSVVLYIGFNIAMFILLLILGQIAPVLGVLVIIPAFWAWVKLGFLPIAAVATRRGESMVSASTGVSQGRFFPVLGRMLMVSLPLIGTYILGFIIIAVSGGGGAAALGLLVIVVGAIVGGLIHAAGMTKIYLESGGPSDL